MAGRDVGENPVHRSRIGVGAAVVVVLLALATTVGIGILRGATATDVDIPIGIATASTTPTGLVYVHVLGAVPSPGLYLLHDGARAVDAIAAAGGFRDDADRGTVNLARLVGDGEQLYVAAQGEVRDAGGAPGVAAGDGRVNLNTADADALDSLPRIGPAIAQRIISWREENGRFTSVEDLRAVPGIGDKMLESLRDLVTV